MDPSAQPTSAHSVKRLGRTYAIGLSLVAALGIVAAGLVGVHASTARDSAKRTNLTGRQRMLTQRVITEAFRTAYAVSDGSPTATRAATELASAVEAWNSGFDRLVRASPQTGVQPVRAADSAALEHLHPLREELATAVAALALNGNATQRAVLADSARAIGMRLIERLDTLVQRLETQHRQYVQRTQQFAVGFVGLLLIVLALEARLVFHPVTRAIGELVRDQEAVKAELYLKADEMYAASVQQEIQNDLLQTQQEQLLLQQDELVAQQATLIEQRDNLEQRTAELSRLTAILDNTPDAVAVFGLTGDVIYANATAEQMLEHTRQRNWTHAAHLLTPGSVRQIRDVGFPRAIRRGRWQGEAQLRSHGGIDRTVIQTLMTHRGSDGRVSTVSVLLQDITEQKMLQDRLQQIAVRDELTGLYNRRGFMERAAQSLRLAGRQGVTCAMLFGDLDAFKAVNDTFGHDVGDDALKTVSRILTGAFRDTDLIARLGGDEFTVLAFNAGPNDIATIRARIEAAVDASNASRAGRPETAWRLGISLGAAYFDPASPTDVEALMHEADGALYEEKRRRKSARAHSAPR